jgi:hypothetical protein
MIGVTEGCSVISPGRGWPASASARPGRRTAATLSAIPKVLRNLPANDNPLAIPIMRLFGLKRVEGNQCGMATPLRLNPGAL